LKFSKDRVESFLGEAFDLLWVSGGFVGFDCSWTGLEWNHFVGWDFFPVGGLKLNSKIGCQVLFLTPRITHKIRNKNSLFFEQFSAQK
jgi:hypothetical protein